MQPKIRMQLVSATSACLVAAVALGAPPERAPVAKAPAALPAMGAQQVVDRYVAARGGAAAWKGLASVAFKGKMGAGATTYEAVTKKLTLERKEREEMQLPYVLETKRPHKSRIELTFNGQTGVQVFDGTAGFKYRPWMGRNAWEAYSADELRQAQAEPGIDGWLIDAGARGSRVESDGSEVFDGKPAYRLKVTTREGVVRRVWIDGSSFLEVREDGEPRKLDGRAHAVTVKLGDWRAEHGLQFPHLIETSVEGVARAETITIDSVTVNPALADARFTRPK